MFLKMYPNAISLKARLLLFSNFLSFQMLMKHDFIALEIGIAGVEFMSSYIKLIYEPTHFHLQLGNAY